MDIVSTKDICKGQPRINFTRITVAEIVAHAERGRSNEWIQRKYPTLTMRQIQDALTYGKAFNIKPTPMTSHE